MDDISLSDRLTLIMISALDKTGITQKMAWLCAEHKMPVNEIVPFLNDLAKAIAESEVAKCEKA